MTGLRPIEQAPREGRRLLGVLLQQRRAELGYTHRPEFARDRLPLTPSGNPNTRILADIEEAYRDTFPESRLRQIAQAYMIAYDSMIDVAHEKAGALVPAPRAVPAAAVLPRAPMGDPVREAAVRPYAVPIWERLDYLRDARGISDPTGRQLAADPDGARVLRPDGTPLMTDDDIQVWDGSRGAMSRADRAWLAGDVHMRRKARNPGRRDGAASA